MIRVHVDRGGEASFVEVDGHRLEHVTAVDVRFDVNGMAYPLVTVTLLAVDGVEATASNADVVTE